VFKALKRAGSAAYLSEARGRYRFGYFDAGNVCFLEKRTFASYLAMNI
jgi:hypothetical protein